MVRLTRIYTKVGDGGQTALGTGERVSKAHPRIVAYGGVDELNASLGIVVGVPGLSRVDRALLQGIQNDLFDVGADLCVPLPQAEEPGARLRVTALQVAALERAIDVRNAKLRPLDSFILPGGTPAAAWLHVARVVCRRTEVDVVRLIEQDGQSVSASVLPYLNRLSDLLFVMARIANGKGRNDILWKPGARRSGRRVGASGSRDSSKNKKKKKKKKSRTAPASTKKATRVARSVRSKRASRAGKSDKA